jgi:hypothetical protein
MRGKFSIFTILSVSARTQGKDELVKDFCYNKPNQIYQSIPSHDTNTIGGAFNVEIGRENVFKPVSVNWSLHETSDEYERRAIDFATNNSMITESTYFKHKNIHTETW